MLRCSTQFHFKIAGRKRHAALGEGGWPRGARGAAAFLEGWWNGRMPRSWEEAGTVALVLDEVSNGLLYHQQPEQLDDVHRILSAPNVPPA